MTERIADGELLEDLQRAAAEADGPLSVQQYRELGEHSRATVVRRFGSWNAAKHKAGLELNRPTEGGDQLGLRERARELYAEEGLSLHEVGDRLGVSANAVHGWLDDVDTSQGLDPAEVLADMRSAAEGGRLSRSGYRARGRHSPKPALRIWGSWTAAVEAAGLEPGGGREFDYAEAERLYEGGMTIEEAADELGVSDSAVLRALRERGVDTAEPTRDTGRAPDDGAAGGLAEHEVAWDIRLAAEGGVLSSTDHKRRGEHSLGAVRRHFDSWADACAAAGVEAPGNGSEAHQELEERDPGDAPGRDEMLRDIRETARDISVPFSERYYAEHGAYDVAALEDEFGSWVEARREAGCTIRGVQRGRREVFGGG